MALAPGLLSFVEIVVADTDTAMAMGSGDVPVLGTPRLLALAEAAAVAAIAPSLESGLTSVGTAAALEHKRPSPVGAEVVVEAELTEVDGPATRVQVHREAEAAHRASLLTTTPSSARAPWSGCSWTGTSSSAGPGRSDRAAWHSRPGRFS